MPNKQYDSSSKSLRYILGVTIGWFGLQQIFTIFFGSGYFYLSSLGIDDTLIALIWLSGPVSGVFQPLFGLLSDRCEHPWGRRHPFILVGARMLACATLWLAWAEEIVAYACSTDTVNLVAEEVEMNSIALSLKFFVAGCVLLANIAIQPVQLGLRALAVDLIPTAQQPQVHAWITRMNLTGGIVGYAIGAIDLRNGADFLGSKRFRILSSLASLNLAVCILLTCHCTHTPETKNILHQIKSKKARTHSIITCRTKFKTLRQICVAQFFCFGAWFPFLYYVAKYIGTIKATNSPVGSKNIGSMKHEATSSGAFALFLFALVSLVSSILIPWLVEILQDHKFFNLNHLGQDLEKQRSKFLSLRAVWLAGQVLFFLCMMTTFWIDNIVSAYTVVAIVGVSWVADTWIPFTLISQEVCFSQENLTEYVEDRNDCKDLTATAIGLHNAATNFPQIIAAIASSILFHYSNHEEIDLSGKGVGVEVWLLRAGGLSALVGAWCVWKVPHYRTSVN